MVNQVLLLFFQEPKGFGLAVGWPAAARAIERRSAVLELRTRASTRCSGEVANEAIAERRVRRHKSTGPRKGQESECGGKAAARPRSGRRVGRIPVVLMRGKVVGLVAGNRQRASPWSLGDGRATPDSPQHRTARWSEKHEGATRGTGEQGPHVERWHAERGTRPEGGAHIRPPDPWVPRGSKR